MIYLFGERVFMLANLFQQSHGVKRRDMYDLFGSYGVQQTFVEVVVFYVGNRQHIDVPAKLTEIFYGFLVANGGRASQRWEKIADVEQFHFAITLSRDLNSCGSNASQLNLVSAICRHLLCISLYSLSFRESILAVALAIALA